MSEDLIIWLIVLGIAAGLFVAWYFTRKDKKTGGGFGTPSVPIPQDFRHQYTRPDGGYVFTMHPIPEDRRDAVLGAMTAGLQKCIDVTNHHNAEWRRYANPAEYAIICISPMARNSDGSPALVTSSGIQTAGTVLNVGFPDNMERGEPIIVLADQGHPDYGWNWLDYLKNAAWFEAEHVREWLNDKAVFWFFVGQGDIHPHFAPPVGNLLAVERVTAKCYFRPQPHDPVVVNKGG